MFTKTLSKNTKTALAILAKSSFIDAVYLGGGTACALQLGHRVSIDLDFFTPKDFDVKELVKLLKKLGSFELKERRAGTILGIFEGVRFSLFFYKYPVLFPYKFLYFVKDKVNILEIRDIAAMKIDAICTRGLKRDFIDLYFICQQQISLKKILSFYDRKYGKLSSNIIHILKSLVYFVDAEISQIPKMLKRVKWEKVKKYFEEEVKKIAV